MTPPLTLIISEAMCPICQNEDSVKGFKVCDRRNRWWSYCYADHTEYAEDVNTYPEDMLNADRLWFCWDTKSECLVHVNRQEYRVVFPELE